MSQVRILYRPQIYKMNIVLKFFKLIAWFLLIAALLFAFTLLFISFKQPSNDRVWEEESAILPDIAIEGDVITIKNFRDWRYSATDKVSRGYLTRTIDVKDITGVQFLISPFGMDGKAAHTFFSFEIKDAPPVSVSIEARREASETYSAFKGLFNNYELWYAWGSEEDFVARRAVYYDDPLLMYPLNVSAETAQKLLIDMAHDTDSLETEPRWYNTFSSNCTSLLATAANHVNKGSIPWNYSMFVTGYADDYLYKLGIIPHDLPFSEEEKKYSIADIVKEIYKADAPLGEFSEELREKMALSN